MSRLRAERKETLQTEEKSRHQLPTEVRLSVPGRGAVPRKREPRFCEGGLPDSETERFFSTDDIGTGTAIFSDEESVNGLPPLPQRCRDFPTCDAAVFGVSACATASRAL